MSGPCRIVVTTRFRFRAGLAPHHVEVSIVCGHGTRRAAIDLPNPPADPTGLATEAVKHRVLHAAAGGPAPHMPLECECAQLVQASQRCGLGAVNWTVLAQVPLHRLLGS